MVRPLACSADAQAPAPTTTNTLLRCMACCIPCQLDAGFVQPCVTCMHGLRPSGHTPSALTQRLGAAANLRLGDARTSILLAISDQLRQSGLLFTQPPQLMMTPAEMEAAKPPH